MNEPLPDPIPPDLRSAFLNALLRYHDWSAREGEPEVRIDRRSIPISAVCGLVMKYRGPMPEAVLSLLRKMTHPGLDLAELQEDRSYGGGARCLLKLISYRKVGHRLLRDYHRSRGEN
jgi:hypothetical protein